MTRPRKPASKFRYFNSSPKVIRPVVMMYVRFPLSLRHVDSLLFERRIGIRDRAELVEQIRSNGRPATFAASG